MRQNWPEKLWLVRHGQSQGNVARDIADEAGLHEIDIDVRDVDVPLSELGHQQAEATGRWFAALPPEQRPEVILSSPYLRARQTAEAICKAAPLAVRESRKVALKSMQLTNEEELWALSSQAFGNLARTEDFAEGPRAFIEKREPQWKGK